MKKNILFVAFLFASILVSSQNYIVSFQVDMSQSGTIHDTVCIAGDFQDEIGTGPDWTPGTVIMTDPDNDSIYEYTTILPAGSYNYKFFNGPAWGIDESVPSACASLSNRFLSLTTDITLPAVCFGQCSECLPPANYNVTFRVDMSEVGTINPIVSVTGDFQTPAGQGSNWTPGTAIMTDIDMDMIYELQVTLPGGVYNFKYVNGDSWGLDEIVPAPCAVSGNRELSLSTDVILDPVCFNSCYLCSGSGISEPLSQNMTLNYQRNLEMLTVDFITSGKTRRIEVFDVCGHRIAGLTTSAESCSIAIPRSGSRICFVRSISDTEIDCGKFLK